MAYSPGALKQIAGNAYDLDQPRIWSYKTTDAAATVRAANYFADARIRGMQAGDLVVVSVVASNVPQLTEVMTLATVGASGATIRGATQELTASGAVLAGTDVLELNHASVVVAATMAGTAHAGRTFIVKDTSATGTAAHTLTLSDGTLNGTATIATLNARDEFLMVHFDSAGRGQVIANVGSVALS